MVHPCVGRNPVHFPRFASIGGKSLVKAARRRRDVRHNKSDQRQRDQGTKEDTFHVAPPVQVKASRTAWYLESTTSCAIDDTTFERRRTPLQAGLFRLTECDSVWHFSRW